MLNSKMVLILIAYSCFFTAPARAATPPVTKKPVSLTIRLDVDGKVIGTPQISIPLGDEGTVIQQLGQTTTAYTMAVIPTLVQSGSHQNIQMSFKISKAINGRVKPVSSINLITQNHREVTVVQRDQKQKLRLRVTPDL